MSIFRIQKKAGLSSRSKVHSEQSAQLSRFNKSQEKNTSNQFISNLIKRRFTTVTNEEYSNRHTLNIRANLEINELEQHKKNRSIGLKKKKYSIQTGLKKNYNKTFIEEQIFNKNRQICTQQLIDTIKQKHLRRQEKQKDKKLLKIDDKKNQFNNLNRNKSGSSIKNKINAINKKKQQQNSLFELAKQFYNSKNVLKALKIFKQLQTMDQNNPQYLYYIGSCLLNQSNHQKSIQYFQLILNLNPKHDQNIYLFQAINYKMLNQAAQAIHILKQGCKIYPQFQEGFFYLGIKFYYLAKLELSAKNYLDAQLNFKKCLVLNQKNQLAKLFLADVKKSTKPQQAVNIYKELSNSYNKKIQESALVKLAFLLVQLQKWYSIDLDKCFKVVLDASSQSCNSYLDILYLKCWVSYKRFHQSQSSLKFEQIKLWLQRILQSQKKLQKTLRSIKLLFRIKLDQKDLYGAEQTLNRCERLGIKLKSYQTWKFLIQGINDIIKRKLEEGQLKLQNCIQLVKNQSNVFSQSKQKNSFKKKRLLKQQLTLQEKLYIYKKACFYYSYIFSVSNKFQNALKIYQKIINQFQLHKQQGLQNHSLKQQQIIIFHNKYISEGIIFHENDNFKEAGQCFKKAIVIKERAQSIFLWTINEIIKFGQQLKLKESLLSKNMQSLEQSTCTLNQRRQKFLEVSCALRKSQMMSPNYSLLYFYHTLVSLYLKNFQEALYLIRMAINTIDQPVSEYYFIQGLTYSLICQIQNTRQNKQLALVSINKAIQIDQTIPQFFKQRSKHFYLLQKYELALQDIQKVLKIAEDDEQAQLLCMFYSYVNNKYQRSQQLLRKVVYNNEFLNPGQKSQNYLQHKYKQFEQALMLRVKKYEYTGYLAKLLINLTTLQNETKLSTQYLNFIQDLIQSRNQYSQFTVYFYNILLASYYTYNCQYYKAINYLFGCLEQIQMFIDEKQKRSSSSIAQNQFEDQNEFEVQQKVNQFSYINTDLMLDEVKFNIVLVTLLKATKQMTKNQIDKDDKNKKDYNGELNVVNNQNNQFQNLYNQDLFQQCLNFLNVFKVQTENPELLEIFKLIEKIIKGQQKLNENQRNRTYQLTPFQALNPLSSNFKSFKFKINDFEIIAKMQVLYPQKLRFNIKPQFDQSFLFNFDIGKVQSKFIPPWFKFSRQSCQQLFTQQIRNQSVLLSQTQRKQSVCIQPLQSIQKQCQTTKNDRQLFDDKQKIATKDWKKMMKLDSKVQKRLNKMMKHIE